MRYLRPIDCHTHLRGEEYPEHDFLSAAITDADAVGLHAICEMPNCKPFLTTIENIQARNRKFNVIKNDVFQSGLSRFTHLGLTTDMEQNRKMLPYIMKNEDGVISDKIFYCHSTGNMGILDSDLQREIWKLKAELGYTGVSIGHFEDPKFFTDMKFDPSTPLTHSLYQSEQAETLSVETQIKNAVDAGFKGTFYIAHVSSPRTVEFIQKVRKVCPFKIVMEATFHHIFLNTKDYAVHGNLVKMNPPLRTPNEFIGAPTLLQSVLNGAIDTIGTDHAPHPLERKKGPTPPSGIPALPFWPRGIELLREAGISEARLADVTFHNANRIFSLNLQPMMVEVEYMKTLWDKYGWNPFSRHDK